MATNNRAGRANVNNKRLIHGCPSATARGNGEEQAYVTA